MKTRKLSSSFSTEGRRRGTYKISLKWHKFLRVLSAVNIDIHSHSTDKLTIHLGMNLPFLRPRFAGFQTKKDNKVYTIWGDANGKNMFSSSRFHVPIRGKWVGLKNPFSISILALSVWKTWKYFFCGLVESDIKTRQKKPFHKDITLSCQHNKNVRKMKVYAKSSFCLQPKWFIGEILAFSIGSYLMFVWQISFSFYLI